MYEERLHDVRLWKIFNDSISVPSRHPFDSSCHVQLPPPPSAPFYFAIFARIHRTMPRNKTRPPLIRITAENPRNCTVAPVSPEREKMVLKSVSGISFRFTILPPILLASLIHRCPLPYRYSRSVNQSSKPERFRNCIFLRIPRDARPDLFPSSLETLRSRSWRERLELLPRK